jgi:hypothetical protein
MKSLFVSVALLLSANSLCAQSTTVVAPPSRIGSRYDVTNSAFGAVGNGSTDDTTAIQAAFNACWNNVTVGSMGGIIEFPGPHTYVISSTINAYDGCQIEGTIGSSTGANSPPKILWNGPAVGRTYTTSAFTAITNASLSPRYVYTQSFPQMSGSSSNRIAPYIVTFSVVNDLKPNQWVEINDCSTVAGLTLNRAMGQVASATGTSAVIAIPSSTATGTMTDSCTLTTVSVVFAFGSQARYMQSISNIEVINRDSNPASVDFLFGSRVDTGTHIIDTWAEKPREYGYYFCCGGINVEFDKGFRSDLAGKAGIYWRASSDSLALANGTITNAQLASSPHDGVAVMLDASQCLSGYVHMTVRNVKTEIAYLAPNYGIYTMLDCPSNANGMQFFLDFDNDWNTVNSATAAGNSYTAFAMYPPNDAALIFHGSNLSFQSGSGSNTTQRFVGLPLISRNDLSGTSGNMPELIYAPPFHSMQAAGGLGSTFASEAGLTQHIGDSNVGQTYQYGIQASDFLYSDTGFAALPNATTLFAGQILAPPAYWSKANGDRYAIDVVYETGTTGSPNGGRTTCKTGTAANQFVCTSATDLSLGEMITVGANTGKEIRYVDATNTANVLVNVNQNVTAVSSPTTLSFTAPVLGPEIQIPTKSSATPSTLRWSNGDMEQNAEAKMNGVAAWVNVAAGTPGRWAGVPLGNSMGQINSSQISGSTGSGNVVLANSPSIRSLTDTGTTNLNNVTISGTCSGCSRGTLRTAQAFCDGRATPSSTITMFGAGSATVFCTSVVGKYDAAQLLMTTSGTLSSLAIRCGHTGVNSSSGVFSVRDLPSGTYLSDADSGVDTGLTVTYGTTKANTTIFDSTHAFAYAKGDLLRIQFTTQGGETLGDCSASFNY